MPINFFQLVDFSVRAQELLTKQGFNTKDGLRTAEDFFVSTMQATTANSQENVESGVNSMCKAFLV
jgi:hypothetical protein